MKSIAIPPRNAARKRDTVPAAPAYAPTPVAAATRSVQRHLGHRFAVGDRLSMAAGGRDISRGAAPCRVVMLLPDEGGPLRYRVRSENENYERIVEEKDLSPLAEDE